MPGRAFATLLLAAAAAANGCFVPGGAFGQQQQQQVSWWEIEKVEKVEKKTFFLGIQKGRSALFRCDSRACSSFRALLFWCREVLLLLFC